MTYKYQRKAMMQEKNPRSLFFRTRLCALIAERGISQRELASSTNLTPQSVSNYVRGARTLPAAEELYALAKYFGVTMESFLYPGDSEIVSSDDRSKARASPTNKKILSLILKLETTVDDVKVQLAKLKEKVGNHHT